MAQAWLSIVEYARAFSMSDMTVRRRIKTGKISSVLKEGKYYIQVEVGENGEYLKASKKLTGQTSPSQNKMLTHEDSFESKQAAMNNTLENQKTEVVSSRPVHLTASPAESAYKSQPIQKTTDIKPQNDKNASTINVDAQNLINLCNNIIHETKKKESIIHGRYQAQINALQNEVHVKNIELIQLKQQLEDLSLLVKVLEKNNL